jgi:hypothetical protein
MYAGGGKGGKRGGGCCELRWRGREVRGGEWGGKWKGKRGVAVLILYTITAWGSRLTVSGGREEVQLDRDAMQGKKNPRYGGSMALGTRGGVPQRRAET